MQQQHITGVEVLLRWQHPEYGLISPKEFIPIAEDTGLIVPIGEWVMSQACEQFAKWRSAGHQHLQLAINLSPRQIRDENLTNCITRILRQCDLPSHSLEFEVKELAMMAEGDYASALLQHFHQLGMKSTVDDFGTGYSSLSRLQSSPITTLKIDRAFVHGLGQGTDDEVIIASIIALAQKLNLDLVAEGVETEEQKQFLIDNGCTRGQGYLFSKPLEASQMESYLKAHQR